MRVGTAASKPMRYPGSQGYEPVCQALPTSTGRSLIPSVSRYRRRARWLYLLPILLTTACTSTPVAVCPAIVDYTPGQQAEAADELLALPAESILTQMIIDYGVLRAKLRACQ